MANNQQSGMDSETFPVGYYTEINWLKQYGAIEMDFNQLSLQFQHRGKEITLQGITKSYLGQKDSSRCH